MNVKNVIHHLHFNVLNVIKLKKKTTLQKIVQKIQDIKIYVKNVQMLVDQFIEKIKNKKINFIFSRN